MAKQQVARRFAYHLFDEQRSDMVLYSVKVQHEFLVIEMWTFLAVVYKWVEYLASIVVDIYLYSRCFSPLKMLLTL